MKAAIPRVLLFLLYLPAVLALFYFGYDWLQSYIDWHPEFLGGFHFLFSIFDLIFQALAFVVLGFLVARLIAAIRIGALKITAGIVTIGAALFFGGLFIYRTWDAYPDGTWNYLVDHRVLLWDVLFIAGAMVVFSSIGISSEPVNVAS